jgi:hypothetical protein
LAKQLGGHAATMSRNHTSNKKSPHMRAESIFLEENRGDTVIMSALHKRNQLNFAKFFNAAFPYHKEIMAIQKIANQTIQNLVHETTALAALSMVTHQEYRSLNNPGHYDAGMNFLGFQPPVNNPQAAHRHAFLTFTWKGTVSVPVAYNDYIDHVKDVLYDFNGSGPHDPGGNDHRWFLPYGSSGLELNNIVIPCDDHLYHAWICYHPICKLCFWRDKSKEAIAKQARLWLDELNVKLVNSPLQITIIRKEPKHPFSK